MSLYRSREALTSEGGNFRNLYDS